MSARTVTVTTATRLETHARCDYVQCDEAASCLAEPFGTGLARADQLPAGWVRMHIQAPEEAVAGRSHWDRYEFVLCPKHAPSLSVTVGSAPVLESKP
jgi:hypothetical protein